MKISLEWLNAYLSRPADADEVEQVLTRQGFPIESRHVVAPPAPDAPADVMLDVEVTSNRPDCLYHVGVAREVAAGTDRAVVAPDCTLPTDAAGSDPANQAGALTSVTLDEPALCPVYTARVIRGVKVGASPKWLVRRLEAIGLRSVNNIVDITNFVMMELGQPLHAFDLARLTERRIVVRQARTGEQITAIDGTKHALRPGMVVIADAVKPVAVAGVMGGLDTEVSLRTTDMLLEAALFSPLPVRQTSRALKLLSDASYRFERGMDPLGVERASRRAAKLMVELAGGRLAEGVVRAGAPEPAPQALEMRVRRCRAILGQKVRGKEMIRLLDRLGLDPTPHKARKAIECRIPTHRLDLKREIDLIEEVGRLHGLDHVRVRSRLSVVARPVPAAVTARRKLVQALIAHGYLETVTFSFIAPRHGEPFVPAGMKGLMIDDERRKGEPMLRPSLLPSLLLCRKSNQDVGNHGVRLFETAAAWARQGDEIVEARKLALLADVEEGGAAAAEGALRDLRGTLEEAVRQLAPAGRLEFTPTEYSNLAVGAAVSLNSAIIGRLGLLAKPVQERFDLQSPVVVVELDLAPLLEAYSAERKVGVLPRFPGIERDLSVVVAESVSWSDLEREVRAAHPALLEDLRFITVYRGKPVPAGSKSVSFRMTFRDPQTTLRHDQVDPQVAAVVERLKAAVKAELRA